MNSFRAYLLGLTTLFLGYVLVEYYRPTPTNWTPTFLNRDKIPYGTYVLYTLLPDLFGRQPVQTIRQPIANQLLPTLGKSPDPDADSTVRAGQALRLRTQDANYVFVATNFDLSRLDQEALLRYVARGNAVFIAARHLGRLGDTLRLRTTAHWDGAAPGAQPAGRRARPDSTAIRLLAAGSPGQRFRYPRSLSSWHFVADSGCAATVLAADEQQRPVLVRVPVGRGAFYLSSTPIAFTNYFLLRPRTADFAAAALSYLPVRPVFWDEYLKQGPLGERSLLQVVLREPALRWAWWLLLAGTGLFVLFEAKRRQRVIPVLKPLPNTTLLFTRTVASLYRQGRNHAPIAEKKIGLFLEYVRLHLQEATSDLNDDAFRERLARKAGVSRATVDALIRRIHFIRTAPAVSAEELIRLNKALQDFRKQARS